MSVFSRIRGFFSRHRNKFIVGGIIITGSILLTKYAQQRLREWQEKETIEFLERNRKQNHFESISRTCDQTISNLSGALYEVIFKAINTDEIIEMLKTNPENKLSLWNDLKILVFAKSGVIIYSTVMLVVTLRIQMSIIGGYLYKDPNSISTEMQEKYLSVCQTFLDLGVSKLSKVMEIEVKKIMDGVNLKKQLKLSDLEAIYWSLQTAVATNNENPIDKFKSYILHENLNNSNEMFNNILRDTADFLDSDEVKSLTTHCINRGFILLGDQIAEFYTQNGTITLPHTEVDRFQNPFEIKKPLAKLLPIINGLLSKQSFPQLLIQQLIASEKLQILSANIYESLL
ncbi:peroxisomal biogenesis factor 3 [Anoplophora glabripennis]|uniref:peroxisomal biogenesis factor 3 n=1 Tax=Anoplophora glabripennis TaxID=217634 RepID=UPI000874B5EE|nr:peroxisomal biogenesis factor 3 [Anoplophora glabripennis]